MNDNTQNTLNPVALMPSGTILGGYRGSIAHGLYVPSTDPSHIDDVDLLGIVVGEPCHYLGLTEWGSRGTREAWHGQYDCVWYELRKAFRLWLQGNPNVLGFLWLEPEHYLVRTPVGDRLLANRTIFNGKHVYSAFAGYASAQLQKMTSREPAELREYLGVTYALKLREAHPTDQNLPAELGDHTNCTAWSTDKLLQRYKHFIRKGENLGYLGDKRKQLVLAHGYDAKNAAHCVRLLKMAKEFFERGTLQVLRTADREELLSIKAGAWPLVQVKAYAEQLFAEVRVARDQSELPEEPDHQTVEQLLIGILKEVIEK